MINSTSNKQVKRAAALASKAKARKEEGLFVAEGARMCRELSPDQVEKLYVTEAFASRKENQSWIQEFSWELVSEPVMKVMADTQTPQGVLALVRQFCYRLEDLLRPDEKTGWPPCLMILETLQDPGNLGTILRAGEGAGISGVVMNRETADIYSPKVIRSTMGSILRVPFVYTDSLKEAAEQIKKAGIRIFAAHLQGKNAYDQEDYTGGCGFMIGNEGAGLSREAAALADCWIRIPMAGQVESLNASVAASVLMFEAARQRRNRRE